jgi:hypothetical protein
MIPKYYNTTPIQFNTKIIAMAGIFARDISAD